MDFKVFDLGLINFASAISRQKDIFNQVKNGVLQSALIICRHYPVITLGRTADKKNILLDELNLKEKSLEIFVTQRGGDVTYHGPGQIIAYPIFNLQYFKKDIHLFLRRLEDVVIKLLSDYKVSGIKRKGFTGVWVGNKKISSIGISIKNWITFHGVSINIEKQDLGNFRFIRPCGMDIEMAALDELAAEKISFKNIKNKLTGRFREEFIKNN
ncbi:MAG: lipoyl(octanoyl) transferase LipB [Candidatus Omnitrophota bacterium]